LSNLSASDIRYLNEDTVGYALLPVMEYLNKVHGSKREPIVCNEDTPLKEVMELAVKNSVHRIWVIEKAGGEVIGEVSMTDMLSMLIGVK
jgi:CBS domain-containing protein